MLFTFIEQSNEMGECFGVINDFYYDIGSVVSRNTSNKVCLCECEGALNVKNIVALRQCGLSITEAMSITKLACIALRDIQWSFHTIRYLLLTEQTLALESDGEVSFLPFAYDEENAVKTMTRYNAPEVRQQPRYDVKSMKAHIYSLGVTLLNSVGHEAKSAPTFRRVLAVMTAENPARRIDLEQLSDECDKLLREQSLDSDLLGFAKQVCSGLLEEAVECGRDRERELEIERERERELLREKERELESVKLSAIAINGTHSPNQLQNGIQLNINAQRESSTSPNTPPAPSPLPIQTETTEDLVPNQEGEGQRKSTRDQSVSTESWSSTDTNTKELLTADLGVEFLSPKNKAVPVNIPVAVVHDSFKSTYVSFESFSSCITPRGVVCTPSRDVITVNDGVLELESTSSSSRLDLDVDVDVDIDGDVDADIKVESTMVQPSEEMERLFAVESTRFSRLRSAIANVLASEFDSARSLLSFGTDEVEIADAAIDIMLAAASGVAAIGTPPTQQSALAWASASFRLKASTFVLEMRSRFVNVPFAQDDVSLVRIYELLRAFRYGGTRDALVLSEAQSTLDAPNLSASFRRQRSVRSRRTNSVTSIGSALSATWQKVVSVGSNSDCDNDNETVVIDDAPNEDPCTDRKNVFDAYRDEVRTFLQLFAPLLTAESSIKHAFAEVYCVLLGSASGSSSPRKMHFSPSLPFYSTNTYIRTLAERAHDENSDSASLRRTAADLERLLCDLDQKLTLESRGVRRTEALLRKTLEGDGFAAAAQRVGVDDLGRLVRQFGSERDAQQCANLRTSQLRLAVSELQRAAFELQYAELLALTGPELASVLQLLGTTSNWALNDHLQFVQPRGQSQSQSQSQLFLHPDTSTLPVNTETERRVASTFCCHVKRAVAASPNGLLVLLFARGALLHGYVSSFLYTSRVYFDWLTLFTSLCRLLRGAVDRYSDSDSSAEESWLFFRVAHRTVLLLRWWITSCAYDGVDLDFSKLDMDDANVSSMLTAALCDLRNAARPGEFAEPVRAVVAHLLEATTLNGLFCDAVHSLIVAQTDADAVDASVSKSQSDSSYSSSNVSRTNSYYGPQRFDIDRSVTTVSCSSSYRVLRERRLSDARVFALVTTALLERERDTRRTGPSSYIRELNDDLLELVRKRDRPLTVQVDKSAVATCLSRLDRPTSADSPDGPLLFSRMQVEDFSLLDHDLRLVTLALTRVAERLLSVLHPADFAALAVKNAVAAATRGSARVQAVREHEQRVASWVPFEFMSCLNERRRAKLLKRFVRVAADCLAQRDLLTAFALLHGLHDHHVRMSATLKSLPQKYSAMLTDLEAAKVRCECERDAMCFANGDERGGGEACRVMPTLPNVSIFEKHLRQLLVGGLTAHNGMARLARLSPFAAQLDQVRLFNQFGYFDERPRGAIYLSLEVGSQSETLLRAVNDLGDLLLSRLLFCSRQNLQNLATLASNSASSKASKSSNGTLRGKKEPSTARNGSLMRTFHLASTKLRK